MATILVATDHGVLVINTAGANVTTVADFAMGILLSVNTAISDAANAVSAYLRSETPNGVINTAVLREAHHV